MTELFAWAGLTVLAVLWVVCGPGYRGRLVERAEARADERVTVELRAWRGRFGPDWV